ncbi:hypothetical protein [Bacillus horti]|uniref:Uncharacterized protein n=1 Tax=Caldalkalibacillus horti TaxID=77523 RepID=A0ABT9W0D1_9BACI|nr:hypothetical protein [Bacillus horti]MDQ0166676.1 hypothetical protein [Bacillus horti]
MSRKKNEIDYPCVKLTSSGERETDDLKVLAKKLAQRKYPTDDNPAIKRLEQRFKSI